MRYSPHQTPIDLASVRSTLDRIAASGDEMTAEAVPILTALVAFENARGASVYNYNWGNITTDNPSDPHFVFPGNPRMFLQFPDHATGAMALVQRLARSPTHRRMLDAANKGDVPAFVRGMTTPSPETGMMYCDTCETATTLRAYRSLVDELRGRRAAPRGGGLGLEIAMAFLVPIATVAVAAWRTLK